MSIDPINNTLNPNQQLSLVLSAILKTTGGAYRITKEVFMAMDNRALVTIRPDPATGEIVLQLFEGDSAEAVRMAQGGGGTLGQA